MRVFGMCSVSPSGLRVGPFFSSPTARSSDSVRVIVLPDPRDSLLPLFRFGRMFLLTDVDKAGAVRADENITLRMVVHLY